MDSSKGSQRKNRYENRVRIIGGEHRGRRIAVADRTGLRPTPDRVRETVFNWLQFDNVTGATTQLGTTSAPAVKMNVPVPQNLPSAPGTYVRAEIAFEGGPESWGEPSHAYFVRDTTGWRLVGFERVPGGNPPRSEDP